MLEFDKIKTYLNLNGIEIKNINNYNQFLLDNPSYVKKNLRIYYEMNKIKNVKITKFNYM